jgi:hypothetical protein
MTQVARKCNVALTCVCWDCPPQSPHLPRMRASAQALPPRLMMAAYKRRVSAAVTAAIVTTTGLVRARMLPGPPPRALPARTAGGMILRTARGGSVSLMPAAASPHAALGLHTPGCECAMWRYYARQVRMVQPRHSYDPCWLLRRSYIVCIDTNATWKVLKCVFVMSCWPLIVFTVHTECIAAKLRE